MGLRGAALLSCMACAVAGGGRGGGGGNGAAGADGRRRLFSDPSAALPGVSVWPQFVSLKEGANFTYTVVLSHQPGLKEDGTLDPRKDEVHVYVTSSQDVYQETAPGVFGTEPSHRSQLSVVTAGGNLSWVDSPSCEKVVCYQVQGAHPECCPSDKGGKRYAWGCGDSLPSTTGPASGVDFTAAIEFRTGSALADWTCPWGYAPRGYGDAAKGSAKNVHSSGNAQSGGQNCGKLTDSAGGCDPTSSPTFVSFDSTNWNVPQTVTVVARDDDVFEPQVNRRGQDAYVHHFVVAQDVDTNHAYYHNVKVNDITVSIEDDDPAVVLQNDGTAKLNHPVTAEGGSSAYIKLRLASEPMFDVRVDTQSGPFFSSCSADHLTCVVTDSTADDIQYSWNGADDNQVLISNAFWALDAKTGKTTPTAADAGKHSHGPKGSLGSAGHDNAARMHLTWTSQTWNVWKTLTIVARDDMLDEGAQRDTSVGYVISSADYYYNSEGAGKVPGLKAAAQPISCGNCAAANQQVCVQADPKQVQVFSTEEFVRDIFYAKDKSALGCGTTITVVDNDAVAVNISATACSATESAATCDYTVRLNSAPIAAANVTVHLREDTLISGLYDHELYMTEWAPTAANASISERVQGSFDMDLRFDDTNWNVPRSVRTVAYDDVEDEPTEERTIYHKVSDSGVHSHPILASSHSSRPPHQSDKPGAVSSSTATTTYRGLKVPSVDVTVTDNDIADVVLGCDSWNGAVGSVNAGTRAAVGQGEVDGELACMVTSVDCHSRIASAGGTEIVDKGGKACVQGTYTLRLSSSPGSAFKFPVRDGRNVLTAHADIEGRIGAVMDELQQRAIKIKVTPDSTPYTKFSTSHGGDSCVFTESNWNETCTVTASPTDDWLVRLAYPRNGEIVDVTAHSVEATDWSDKTYWFTRNVPFQKEAKYVDDAAKGRIINLAHTKFRHPIQIRLRNLIDRDSADWTRKLLEPSSVLAPNETMGSMQGDIFTHSELDCRDRNDAARCTTFKSKGYCRYSAYRAKCMRSCDACPKTAPAQVAKKAVAMTCGAPSAQTNNVDLGGAPYKTFRLATVAAAACEAACCAQAPASPADVGCRSWVARPAVLAIADCGKGDYCCSLFRIVAAPNTTVVGAAATSIVSGITYRNDLWTKIRGFNYMPHVLSNTLELWRSFVQPCSVAAANVSSSNASAANASSTAANGTNATQANATSAAAQPAPPPLLCKEKMSALVDQELAIASYNGFNSVRLSLNYVVWQQRPSEFLAAVRDVVDRAWEYGISTVLVPFDLLVFPNDRACTETRLQFDSVENCWWPSPGYHRHEDSAWWAGAGKNFSLALLKAFPPSTPGLLAWDVVNQPDSYGGTKSAETWKFVESAAALFRNGTTTPKTIGVANITSFLRLADKVDVLSFQTHKPLSVPLRAHGWGGAPQPKQAAHLGLQPDVLDRERDIVSSRDVPGPDAGIADGGLHSAYQLGPHAGAWQEMLYDMKYQTGLSTGTWQTGERTTDAALKFAANVSKPVLNSIAACAARANPFDQHVHLARRNPISYAIWEQLLRDGSSCVSECRTGCFSPSV